MIIHRFRVLQEDIDPHHRSHQYSLWQTENGMEALDWSSLVLPRKYLGTNEKPTLRNTQVIVSKNQDRHGGHYQENMQIKWWRTCLNGVKPC